tara:strand:+ start:668 stop:1072 length:405 start_codon:yes stop_codon:yes gene_type:complete
MATTTATLTLSSGDLTGDALSLSTTTTLTKAGTVTGLDQTSGVGRKTTTATTQYTLFDGADYTADKGHKVYIKNTSAVATEFVTVTMNAEAIGRLYSGDWMFFPWGANADTNDIKLTPSVATTLTVEYMVISEA